MQQPNCTYYRVGHNYTKKSLLAFEHAAMSNLNFDISHAHFNAIYLHLIHAFEQEKYVWVITISHEGPGDIRKTDITESRM